MGLIEPLIVGVSIYTAHWGQSEHPPGLQVSNQTPGVYVQAGYVMAAVFRNSLGRTSVLGGLTVPVGPVDLSFGLASGYQYKRVQIPCSPEFWAHWGIGGPPWPADPLGGCTGISGTTSSTLKPIASLSYRLPVEIAGVAPRLTWLGKALSLGVEYKFR